MSVRILFPKPNLAALLRSAGGTPVAEAVEQAQANLDALAPECRAALLEVAQGLDACFAAASAEDGAGAARGLYALASGAVGVGAVAGMPRADDTLISLCTLIDHLQLRRAWDAEAVAVHLRTLRFFVGADASVAEAGEALLEGLRRVSDRYRPEEGTA